MPLSLRVHFAAHCCLWRFIFCFWEAVNDFTKGSKIEVILSSTGVCRRSAAEHLWCRQPHLSAGTAEKLCPQVSSSGPNVPLRPADEAAMGIHLRAVSLLTCLLPWLNVSILMSNIRLFIASPRRRTNTAAFLLARGRARDGPEPIGKLQY